MAFSSISLLVLSITISNVVAFGAGNIPSYGALEGVAFRHGDIEDILLQLAMVPITSGTSGFLSSLNPLSSAGKKFNAMAVKRVYFGNWLRDYSQAVDVGTLSKGLDPKTIRLLVWVMGFMAFGYATEEFEVTNARLGVYRPEEHIDNPKGYPNPEEHDARKFDSRLRGPVQAAELEVDPQTGMKNYIANERGGWMTSASYIRNSLLRCIELGRDYAANHVDTVRYESLRVLGQALHTLEDFSAHSNFCELVLNDLGYSDVFPQVGTSTAISLNGKRCYPLTTGTFGGLDFVHSLLGEATDKISQTQISEVANGLSSSSTHGSSGLLNSLQGMTTKIPGFALPREMEDISREADALRRNDNSRANFGYTVDTDADAIAQKIYPIMAFRDRIMKGLSAFFDKIPGLSALVDEISETLTVWVLATIEPFMKPIVEKVTAGLGAGQSLVTAKDDQLAVFEDPHCSDPTHSMLAKDHFSCYLNHPAGLIGQAVVKHTVVRITAAWQDTRIEPYALIDEILEILHHPAAAQGRTTIQREMREIVNSWINNLGPKKHKVLHGLSFDGVKQGQHHEGGTSDTTGVFANHSHTHSTSSQYGPGRQTVAAQRQSDLHHHSTVYNRPDQTNLSHVHSYNEQSEPSSQHNVDTGAASSYYNTTSHYKNTGADAGDPSSTVFAAHAFGQDSNFETGRLTTLGSGPGPGPGPSYLQESSHQAVSDGSGRSGWAEPYGRPSNDYMANPAQGMQYPQTYGDSGDWTRPQHASHDFSTQNEPQNTGHYGSQGYYGGSEQDTYGRQYR